MTTTMARVFLPTVFVILLGSCAERSAQQVYTVPGYQVMVTQPQPVYVTQPQPVYVTRPQPVYVTQPAPVVIRRPVIYTQPPVMTPARVYVGGYQNYPAYRQCVPGTVRGCQAYCGGGTQTCNYDGMSWGSCVEHYNDW